MSTATYNFSYGFTAVRDLRVGETQRTKNGRLEIHSLELDGRKVHPTARFWRSFFSRFGIAENVFRYFEPHEVFQRISQRAADDSMRYCVEHDPDGRLNLLAVSNPDRPVIRDGEIRDLAARYGGTDISYLDGVLTSTHRPRGLDRTVQIGGDQLQQRFVLETPLDGFGAPRIYLSLLRLICSNGAIGYTPAFRSEISLGKDLSYCISRALDSFDNDDGYAALRQRFESAQTSWASVHECGKLHRLLQKLGELGEPVSEFTPSFRRLTGNLHELYGLANLDALSLKRQRVLPARCRVYDLLNFASELATHRVSGISSRYMQAFIGDMLSDEYDLEGTAETVTEFSDFLLPSRN